MRQPILICGVASESPIAMAVQACERLAVDYLLIDQRQLTGQDIEVALIDGQVTARLWQRQLSFDLAACPGAYSRAMPASLLRDPPGDTQGLLHHHYFVDSLNAWLEFAPLRVANRLSVGLSNASKPWQAQLIEAAGLAVPKSLVTNDPAALDSFRKQQGSLIFKSASGIRSIVKRLEGAYEARIPELASLPTLFQAYVPGVNYRVHVVGERVFAVRIDSAATDYRYATRDNLECEMQPDRLPPEIARRCVRLSESLGLVLSGIDLKLTPTGEYICFEINPSPAYSCFAEESSEAVAEALVTFLQSGARRGSHRKRQPLESPLA